ncbi:hypothetical protein QP185_00275 [Sphingomonas aerolata]|uniref:hypothetical protein n=1 Tax=Sphingomonas aerolata TaxID=185951 RepID=UPI002FE10E49
MQDIYGRRVSILLSTILFVSTSICGAMPSYSWNLVMCFLMGCSAGGMLPVVYTLLAEIMPRGTEAGSLCWLAVLDWSAATSRLAVPRICSNLVRLA